jgi:Cd2+/Zn2+-exporting ATPase
VAFDKTGTLTVGRPKVTDVVPVDGVEDDVLAKAAAAESGSSHPLGLAIIAAAEAKQVPLSPVFGGATAVPGKAVTARLREGFVSVGSPRYAAELGTMPGEVSARIQVLEREGKTVVTVILGKRILGLIALRDEPRDDAAAGIARLKQLGTRPLMLRSSMV